MAAARALRALPWARIYAVARVVAERLGDDIPPKDRRRLADILKRSKGNPTALTDAERREVVAILRRVDVSRLGRDLAAVGVLARGARLLGR